MKIIILIVVALIVGAMFGIIAMCMLASGKRDDEIFERYWRKKKESNEAGYDEKLR